MRLEKEQRKIFIVSTGRTGTGFLSRFLDKFDGVKAFHEPNPRLRKVVDEYYNNRISREEVIDTIKETRSKIFQGSGTFVECNWALTPLLDCVYEAFPDAIFIHIVRDARDVVASVRNKGGWFKRENFIGIIKPHHFRIRQNKFVEAVKYTWNGYDQLYETIERIDKHGIKIDNNEEVMIAHASWYWNILNHITYQSLIDIRDKGGISYLVRFENLFTPIGMKYFVNKMLGIDQQFDVSAIEKKFDTSYNKSNAVTFDEWDEYHKSILYNYTLSGLMFYCYVSFDEWRKILQLLLEYQV